MINGIPEAFENLTQDIPLVGLGFVQIPSRNVTEVYVHTRFPRNLPTDPAVEAIFESLVELKNDILRFERVYPHVIRVPELLRYGYTTLDVHNELRIPMVIGYRDTEEFEHVTMAVYLRNSDAPSN